MSPGLSHRARTRTASALALALLLTKASTAHTQRFSFSASSGDSAQVAAAMRALAVQVLASYRDADPRRDLDARFRLEIVAGHFDDASRSLRRLRAARNRRTASPAVRALDAQYEIWLDAAHATTGGSEPLATAFAAAFRKSFSRYDNLTAALVMRAMAVGSGGFRAAFTNTLTAQQSRDISLADALSLVKSYQRLTAHSDFATLLQPLFNEEDARRYVVQRNVSVRMSDGATVCALIVRPRGAPRLPSVMTFTIYADSVATFGEARRTAAQGYAGIVGFTRGKACSPDAPVPYIHDGHDATELIDWIAKQSWSDGRVGMFGGSYNGMAAWGATRYMPKPLKAIMVGAPVAPGLDVPMEGNIPVNFIYPWPFYTTDNKTLDNATYYDNTRWSRLWRTWYVTGRAYRDLPAIDEHPNPFWEQWIAHPSYDAYWQSMIPYREEFRKITIPVLQTAGYYFGGPGAAMYYLSEHYRYLPTARHYLLIGPYDHPQGQRGVVDAVGDTTTVLAGYPTDPVSHIDIVADVRYAWFDWILRGGKRPALLSDRVNYEVMGANRWAHTPSIRAMSNDSVRLFMRPATTGTAQRLALAPAPEETSTLRVDLSKRTDIDSIFAGGGVVDSTVNDYEALRYVSEPLRASEISGLYSGHLEFIVNKKDFDLSVALFELTAQGEYVELPPVQLRASYARDLTTRQLLSPGVRQILDFQSIRLVSRHLGTGSRIVAVIGPIKSPGLQINYGSGKDVNAETVRDAGDPLQITVFGNSFLRLPLRR